MCVLYNKIFNGPGEWKSDLPFIICRFQSASKGFEHVDGRHQQQQQLAMNGDSVCACINHTLAHAFALSNGENQNEQKKNLSTTSPP